MHYKRWIAEAAGIKQTWSWRYMARDWEDTFCSWAQPPSKTEEQRSENAIGVTSFQEHHDDTDDLRRARLNGTENTDPNCSNDPKS